MSQVSKPNYLLAGDEAVSSEPSSWDVPEELADLFAAYMKSDAAPKKLFRLQCPLKNLSSTSVEEFAF